MHVLALGYFRPSKHTAMATPVRYLVENYGRLMGNGDAQFGPRLFMRLGDGMLGRSVILENAEGETVIAYAELEDWEGAAGQTFKLYHHSFVTQRLDWILALVRDGETSPFVWLRYRPFANSWVFDHAFLVEGDTGLHTIIYDSGADWLDMYQWRQSGTAFYGIQKNGDVQISRNAHDALSIQPVTMERKRYGGRDEHGAIIWTEMGDDRIYYKGQVVGSGDMAQVDPYGMYYNDPQQGYIPSITFTPAIHRVLQSPMRNTVRALLFLARAQSAGRVDRNALVASNYQQLPADLLYVLWSWVLSAGPN